MNTKEMIAVVQCYIKTRKDVDVDISIKSLHDLPKLTLAYQIALEWFNENNIKISQLN